MPTLREINKMMPVNTQALTTPTKPEIKMMREKIEEVWKKPITGNCPYCLRTAYISIIDNRTGYVTDEELIEASGGKLKHK
jgi:hypothetical protein